MRRLWLAAHVLGWLLLGVGLAEGVRHFVPQPVRFAYAWAEPMALFYGFAVLSAWWTCRARPLSRIGLERVALFQLGVAAQVAAIWTAAGTLWGVSLARLLPEPIDRPTLILDAAVLLVAGVPLYLLSAGVHYLAQAFEESREQERRLYDSQVAAREAELRALRAQLNPHFLFNSLNSINALVGSDPEAARRMCEGLGDFLRRTLTLGARDAVTLGEELALVDGYLAIEQVRFGDRLRIEREVDPGAGACRVPPLLLQPLVENAIKHGVANRLEGGVIRIEARRDGGSLRIAVVNPVDADAPSRSGPGVGLENVRRRLDAFGAREARLDAVRGDDWFRVTLLLPADVAAPEPARA
jgi:signal transduction histidine kinase